MTAFTISSLWRYPVKSMAGEELNSVDVTASGLRGDRAYALVDTANGKVGSAKSVKRFGELLKYQAQFVTQPGSDSVVPPVRITLPDGTSLDSACIHILTTSALQRLQEGYPEGQFSIQRFRPNIVVDCADESGFVENSWIGHILAIGPELILRVSIPCPRCVMTTLPRVDLLFDSKILRTVARLNTQDLGEFGNLPCVGVYADVVKPGRIRCGDPVRVGD